MRVNADRSFFLHPPPPDCVSRAKGTVGGPTKMRRGGEGGNGGEEDCRGTRRTTAPPQPSGRRLGSHNWESNFDELVITVHYYNYLENILELEFYTSIIILDHFLFIGAAK